MKERNDRSSLSSSLSVPAEALLCSGDISPLQASLTNTSLWWEEEEVKKKKAEDEVKMLKSLYFVF